MVSKTSPPVSFHKDNREEERFMEGFLNKVHQISRYINVVAGIAITFIMLLTVADVILRIFRKPIVGTYELVGFSGAIVIGFAIPLTSWMRGAYLRRFLRPEIFSEGTKDLQCRDAMPGDRSVFPHRLEPHQGRHGSPEIRRGFPDLTTAFLPGCLCRWHHLLFSMSGALL